MCVCSNTDAHFFIGGIVLTQQQMINKKRRRIKKIMRFIMSWLIVIFTITGIVVLITSLLRIAVRAIGESTVKAVITQKKYDTVYVDDSDELYYVNGDGDAGENNDKYWNIALLGIDTRVGEDNAGGVRSDSILVLSVDRDTGDCKIISVYRDSLLSMYSDADRLAKVNEAYAAGGATEVINTLNKNLDLSIKDYVVVNFAGMADIIDAVGGIDIDITEDEKTFVNAYLDDNMANTGMVSEKLSESGLVHFNGLQALAYCRVRYTDFYDASGNVYKFDMGRTARQRLVLEELSQKVRTYDKTKIGRLLDSIFAENQNSIFTNIEYNKVIDNLELVFKVDLDVSDGFPFDYQFVKYDGAEVVAADSLESNVKKLHEILYGETEYEVSDTVKQISSRLDNAAGIGTGKEY